MLFSVPDAPSGARRAVAHNSSYFCGRPRRPHLGLQYVTGAPCRSLRTLCVSQLTAHTCNLLWRTGPGRREQPCPEVPGRHAPTRISRSAARLMAAGTWGAHAQSSLLRLRAALNLWCHLFTGWALSSSLLSCPLPPCSCVLEARPSLIACTRIPAPRLCFGATAVKAHT